MIKTIIVVLISAKVKINLTDVQLVHLELKEYPALCNVRDTIRQC